MSLEKTEKYTQKLENVRREPQNTEEEKQDKKEHAKEFRMEVMLDNARLIENVTSQLEYNWWSTKEDLMNSTKKVAEFLAHPEVAEAFIDNLLETQKRLNEVLDRLQEQDRKYIAHSIYHGLVKSEYEQYKFNGSVTLDSSYPLAIILYIENDEDFKRIDSRQNIGGFYQASASHIDSILGKDFKFPLIVIKGGKENLVESGRIVIEEHEKGHAEHKRLESTMKENDIKSVWLEVRQPPRESLRRLSFEHSEKDWNVVMDYALERAKDELLAEFKATGSTEYHLNNLLMREGVYDYFHSIGLTPDSWLYKDLWERYENTLRTTVRIANHVLNSQKVFGLGSRVDLMRWVLAQIPLKDWENQITKSAFWDEANGLYDCLNKPKEVPAEAYQEFVSRLRSNQSHSLLPLIREYRDQWLN